MAIVARILSPRDFGVFAVALTVSMVIQSFSNAGVAVVITRGDVDVDEVAPTVATISLLTGIMLSGFMFVFAAPLATALGARAAAAPLRVLAISVALGGCFPIPNSLMARDFRQRENFMAVATGSVASSGLMVALALSGAGAMSFAWAVAVGHLITGGSQYYYVRRFDRPGFRLDVAKRVLRYSLPVAGAALLSTVLLNVDYAVVGRTLGPYRLGLYLLAFNVASWPTALLSATIFALVIPAFSRLSADPVRHSRAVFTAVRSVSLVAFPICALTCSLSLPLLVTVYGPKWAASAPVLSTLAVYGSAAVLCLLLGEMTISQGRTSRLLKLQVLWLICLVPAMVIGVHWRGIIGAGAAHVVVILFIVIPAYVAVFVMAGLGRVRDLVRAAWPPLVSAVLCGLAALAASAPFSSPLVQLLFGALVGGLVYVAIMGPLLAELLAHWLSPQSRFTLAINRYAVFRRACLGAFSPTARKRRSQPITIVDSRPEGPDTSSASSMELVIPDSAP
jgi:PST family polysaccharide transporter